MSSFVNVPADTGYGLDKGWIMTSAGFVFLMQLGLGLMEIGSIRRKNSRIVWYKILLNTIFTIWWWYIIGFAWAFGRPNGSFVGAEIFYAGDRWGFSSAQSLNGVTQTGLTPGPGYSAQFAHWVWRVSIALVSTTIATGIVTERVTLKAVAVFNFFFNLIILPFIFSWTFGLGFLADDIGYRDYSGGFVIFGVGAFAGLIGLLLIKPRYNFYNKYPVIINAIPAQDYYSGSADPRLHSAEGGHRSIPAVAFDRVKNEPVAVPSSTGGQVASPNAFTTDNIIRARRKLNPDEFFGVTNFGFVVVGALITFIGFIFFNAGASQGLQTSLLYTFAEVAAASTLMGAMGSALFTILFLAVAGRRRPVRDNAATIARAFIAGAVAICADAHIYRPWEAGTIGILAAWSYLIMSYVFKRLKWDDPAEFFPMFAAPAICGLICSAFFNIVNGIFFDNATEGEILIWQLLSMGILLGWTVIISLLAWGIMKLFRGLRIGLKTEIVGYDHIDEARDLASPDKEFAVLEKERVK